MGNSHEGKIAISRLLMDLDKIANGAKTLLAKKKADPELAAIQDDARSAHDALADARLLKLHHEAELEKARRALPQALDEAFDRFYKVRARIHARCGVRDAKALAQFGLPAMSRRGKKRRPSASASSEDGGDGSPTP